MSASVFIGDSKNGVGVVFRGEWLQVIRLFAGGARSASSGLGCLLCNTAVERAALDPGAGRYVAAYLDRLTKAFHHALHNGQQSGQLDSTANLDELAAFFTMALIGVVACIRAEAPPEQVQAACRVATSTLDAQHYEARN